MDNELPPQTAKLVQEIYEQILVRKAQALWDRFEPAWQVHQYLLSLGAETELADKITLQVTGVNFTGDNSQAYQ
ncbi:hypothetical protein [Nostoc sp.]|uniref:hypothetical protein n=1 Tax=Nostoc sp. TaxID=1180 RepID=UPI002FF8F2FB